MRCDICGMESDFEAAFVRERRTFRRSRRTVCPTCSVRRDNSRNSWFLLGTLAAGLAGFVISWLDPYSFWGAFLVNLFLIELFLVLSIVPHELGHALAARALGWRVYQIEIGLGKSLWKRRLLGMLFDVRAIPVAGATWMMPEDMRWYRSKRFIAVLAGPAVNVAMAFALALLWNFVTGYFEWYLLPRWARLFILANVWVAVANLFPFQPKTGFALPSDGKQLLQLLSFKKSDFAEVQAARFALEAMLCREAGDFAGARQKCDEGLVIAPDHPILLNMSGINYLDENRYDRAREVLLKLLEKQDEKSPMRFLLLNNLAYADALSQNPEWLAEADAYSLAAYARLPWAAAVVGTRGTVLVELGRYEEGIKLLKQSMENAETPRNRAENACHVAMALARMGNREEAGQYLSLARQLHDKCPILPRAERIVLSPAECQVAGTAASH